MRKGGFQDQRSVWVRGLPPAAERLRKIGLSELRFRVNRLRRMDAGKLTDEQVAGRIRRVMDGYSTNCAVLGTHGVFRARKHEPGVELYENANELWYPPAERVRLGRFNRPNDVRFYASNLEHAALAEVQPAAGDRVTLLVAATKSEADYINASHIGLHKIRDGRIAHGIGPNLRSHDSFQRNLEAMGIDRHWTLVDDYLSDMALALPQPNEAARLYRVTNAISDVLAGINQRGALFYPSVATKLGSYNLALAPAVADRLFYPFEAWAFEFVADNVALLGENGEVHEDMQQLRAVARTTGIGPSGQLEWREIDPSELLDLHTALSRAHHGRGKPF